MKTHDLRRPTFVIRTFCCKAGQKPLQDAMQITSPPAFDITASRAHYSTLRKFCKSLAILQSQHQGSCSPATALYYHETVCINGTESVRTH